MNVVTNNNRNKINSFASSFLLARATTRKNSVFFSIDPSKILYGMAWIRNVPHTHTHTYVHRLLLFWNENMEMAIDNNKSSSIKISLIFGFDVKSHICRLLYAMERACMRSLELAYCTHDCSKVAAAAAVACAIYAFWLTLQCSDCIEKIHAATTHSSSSFRL